jgi:phosphosulfolactate phosphohydrolase-like enzyme
MHVLHYHTPDLVPSDHNADCAVVIDVLRATSTIAHVLSAGAEAVVALRCDALNAKQRLRESCTVGNYRQSSIES